MEICRSDSFSERERLGERLGEKERDIEIQRVRLGEIGRDRERQRVRQRETRRDRK